MCSIAALVTLKFFTSPATVTMLVVTSVSIATRVVWSPFLRPASTNASDIWSATLSGCPLLTLSLVKM